FLHLKHRKHPPRVQPCRLRHLFRQGKNSRLVRDQQQLKTRFASEPAGPVHLHVFFLRKGSSTSPGQSEADPTDMKFTAVIVFGATSSAGFSLSLSVGSRFWLAAGRPEQPWCWEVTPVYFACQEADTIYCTLVTPRPSNSTTSSFPAFYGCTRLFWGGFYHGSPQQFIHRPRPATERLRFSCIGWMEPQKRRGENPMISNLCAGDPG